MSDIGTVSRLFCAHWKERSSPSAARKALEANIPGFSRATLPIDLEAAGRWVGIEHVIHSDLTGCDGLLSATPSGTYVATLRRGQTDARVRFTLAHEIGHAIVFRSLGKRTDSENRQLHCKAATEDERDEERLCDVIAAELLMPRQQFGQAIEEVGVSASTIPLIAQRFGVSLQAASRRIAEILPYDVSISLWVTNDEHSRFIPRWYLTQRGARSLDHVIGIGEPGSACFTNSPVRGWHWIPLQGPTDKYFIDVAPLQSSASSWIVIAIFNAAAQHIANKISMGRASTGTATQIPLAADD